MSAQDSLANPRRGLQDENGEGYRSRHSDWATRCARNSPVNVGSSIVAMPVPFGNVLTAMAVMFLGLGLMFRDGVAVILGQPVAPGLVFNVNGTST